MSTFCLLIGFGLLVKAGWTWYKMHRWLAKAKTVQGLVEDYAPGMFMMGNTTFAIVRFSVNGQSIVFQDKWPTGTGSVGIGQQAIVWYNPQNVQDALVNAQVIRWSLPAAWVLGASLFLVMGFTSRGL